MRLERNSRFSANRHFSGRRKLENERTLKSNGLSDAQKRGCSRSQDFEDFLELNQNVEVISWVAIVVVFVQQEPKNESFSCRRGQSVIAWSELFGSYQRCDGGGHPEVVRSGHFAQVPRVQRECLKARLGLANGRRD